MSSSIDNLNTLKKRSVNGVISYFLRTVFLQIFGLVALLFLSKFLSPAEFGIYGLVMQIIGLLLFFSDVGLAAVLVQKKTTPSLEEYRVAFTLQQLLSWLIVLFVVGLISTNLLDEKIGASGRWLLLSLAFCFPLASLKTIPSIMLERELDFGKLVIPQIFEQLVFYIVVLILAARGFGVTSYAYAVILRSVVGVSIMYLLKPWSIGLSFQKNTFKGLTSFGLKFQANDLLSRLKDQLFYLAVGLYLPNKEFGYLSWAKNWSMYPYQLTVQNIMTVTFPTFARIQNDKSLLKKAIEKSLFAITLFIFPVLIVMSLYINKLVFLVEDYQKWQPAVFGFVLFCLSIGWAAISTPLTNTLNALGQINTTLKIMIFWTALTWILTPVAVWLWGFNGVAIAALLISFTSLIPVYYAKKYVAFSFIDQVWRQLTAGMIMFLFGYFSLGRVNSLQDLVFAIVLSGLVYLLVMLLLGRKKFNQEFLPIWQALFNKC